MVVTRRRASGGGRVTPEARSVYLENRRCTRKKVQKKGDEHEHGDHIHQSPHSAPQLTHSEAHLLSDLLTYQRQNMKTHPYEGGITKMARRDIEIENCNKPKVEENAGRNSTSIQKAHKQLHDRSLTGSDVQADIENSNIQIPDAENMNLHPAFSAEQEGTPHPNVTTANEATISADKITSQREDNVASKINNSQGEERGSLKNRSQPSLSLNLTEIAEQMNIDNGTEVDSLGCDGGLSSIRGYKVKPEYVNLLSSILSKYGDIAAKCSDKPVAIRSFYMEYLCLVLDKLVKTEFVKITRTELEDMLASLSHIGGEGVEVGWLKKRVHIIYEANLAISVLRPTSDVKQRLVQKKANIRSIKEQLEVCNKDYAIKRAHIAKLEEEIHAKNSLLSVEVDEVRETETMLSDYKAKLRHVFGLESLAQSLI